MTFSNENLPRYALSLRVNLGHGSKVMPYPFRRGGFSKKNKIKIQLVEKWYSGRNFSDEPFILNTLQKTEIKNREAYENIHEDTRYDTDAGYSVHLK